jgi:hypothetical protein
MDCIWQVLDLHEQKAIEHRALNSAVVKYLLKAFGLESDLRLPDRRIRNQSANQTPGKRMRARFWCTEASLSFAVLHGFRAGETKTCYF